VVGKRFRPCRIDDELRYAHGHLGSKADSQRNR
jgi:hypothetical protein